MNSMNRILITSILALELILEYAPSLSAQEGTSEEFTLEEITVTAQKREENQQKVPIAMDVISGDEINELGHFNIDQILSNVAGAFVNKSGDGLRVTIRGVSQDAGAWIGAQSSAPTVAVNTDGVFSERNSSGNNLYDMERVEVLLGPQSTLYASNSPGGIVNIITADPKTDKYEASGTIEYGNFNLLRTQGAMNAPVSDHMALRASFSTSVRDGYLNNGADNEDMKSARLKALFKFSEKFSFILTGELTKDNSKMGFGSGVNPFETQDDVDDPWTVSSRSASESNPATRTQKKLTGRVDLDLGFGSLVLIPAYTTSVSKTSGTMSFGAISITQERTNDGYEKGAELRITSSSDSFLKWIAGGNWYKSEDLFTTVSSDGSISHEINRIASKAVYANTTYPVTDQFRITGGLRYTWEDTYQYHVREKVYETRPEYNNMDYMAGVEYDLGSDSMLYSNFTTGYRTQAAMAYDGYGNAFPHETLDAYTIGSKNRFFGNRLQVNASGYYYKYKNYPADDMVQTLDRKDLNNDGDYDDTGLYDPETDRTRDETQMTMDNFAREVGDLDVIGVEFQTSALITKKDNLDLSVSYLKSEYSDLYFDYMDITNELGIDDVDYSGKEKTNSPNWTIDLSYSHNFNLWNGGALTARIDSRYQSSFLLVWKERELGLNADYTPRITDIGGQRTQEAYHLSNLSMIYANPDGKWTFTGYIKNLENYALKKSWISGSMVIGSPRTYGAILSVKF